MAIRKYSVTCEVTQVGYLSVEVDDQIWDEMGKSYRKLDDTELEIRISDEVLDIINSDEEPFEWDDYDMDVYDVEEEDDDNEDE